MLRGISLSVAGLMLLAAPVFAANPVDTCKEPVVPKMPQGKTAAAADLIKAAGEVKTYVMASDDYQQCIKSEVDKWEMDATASKMPLDPKFKNAVLKKGDDNQAKKERLGAAYQLSATEYKAAHPPGKKP
jgi:hypothetical protein